MKTTDYYNTAPSQKVFDDIKKNSIKIWKTYDNTYGYVTGKLNRIKDLENIGDNAWMMVAMFDSLNKAKLLKLVKPETARQILRIIGEML